MLTTRRRVSLCLSVYVRRLWKQTGCIAKGRGQKRACLGQCSNVWGFLRTIFKFLFAELFA